MGLLDTVARWFKREAADVRDSVDALEDRVDADLTRRERELRSTPEERMETIQADTGVDDAMAEIQAKIDSTRARAEATSELLDPEPE